MNVLPCQKVIGKACFKAFPEFARRAIAYRLLHLLIPPDIAKILPKSLKDPLIAPGVKIPLDAKFPPGTCIVPGCSFPSGWDPDQDPPECAKSAPLPTLAMIASGGNPNVFLAPGPSGPLPVQASASPEPEEELWFDEPFNDLTTHAWTIVEGNNGTVDIISGKLQLKTPAISDSAYIYRTDSRSLPTNMEAVLTVKATAGDGGFALYLDNGTYFPGIGFELPDQLLTFPPGETVKTDMGNIVGVEAEIKVVTTGNLMSVYRDDVAIVEDMTMRGSIFANGYMRLACDEVATWLIDSYTIKEVT